MVIGGVLHYTYILVNLSLIFRLRSHVSYFSSISPQCEPHFQIEREHHAFRIHTLLLLKIETFLFPIDQKPLAMIQCQIRLELLSMSSHNWRKIRCTHSISEEDIIPKPYDIRKKGPIQFLLKCAHCTPFLIHQCGIIIPTPLTCESPSSLHVGVIY